MLSKFQILQKLAENKIVAVIRAQTTKEAISISKASITGGLKVIEVTYTTPDAGQVIKELRNEDVLIGAGTVLDSETARTALLNDAQFIVSPHFDKRISELCNLYAKPYLPGCLTIKEMVLALKSGCDVIKLFPANNFSPSFIKSINGPLPQIQVMPTGGINLNNFKDWLDDGAFAVGIGSDLSKSYANEGEQAVINQCNKYLTRLREVD